MGMSMGMGLHLNMQQRQEIHLSQEQKQELLQKLSQNIKEIRSKTNQAPEEMLENVIEKIVKNMPEPFNNIIPLFFGNPETQKHLLEKNVNLIKFSNKDLNLFIIDYLYDTQTDYNNNFSIQNDKESAPENVEISKDYFSRAMKNPDDLINELGILEQAIKDKVDNPDTIKHIKEIRNALAIASSFQNSMNDIITFLKYTLTFKVDDEKLLYSFLQDSYLLEKLDFILTERSINKLVSTFSQRPPRERTTAKKYITPFLNAVGEFTLISMGIISPNVFTLQKAKHNNSDIMDLEDDLKKDGINLNEILKKYKIKTEGTIFWNRYHTLNHKPTRITDELIREFIINTVRKDKKVLLEAANFESFFDEMKDEFLEIPAEEKRQKNVKKDFFFEKCIELFNQEEFQEKIIDLIKTNWNKELRIFYKK